MGLCETCNNGPIESCETKQTCPPEGKNYSKKLPENVGDIADHIYFDGVCFFVTCDECGNEQGDIGGSVRCKEERR